MTTLYRSSAVLFLLNCAGGLLNYLFLYLAVKRLPVDELGSLSSDLTIYNLALVSGTFAQYWALFARLTVERLRWVRWGGVALSVGVLLLFLSGELRSWSVRSILLSSLPLAVLMQFVAGRFQRVYAFAWFGAGGVLWAALKLAYAFLGVGSKDFALAIPLSTAIVLILMLLLVRFIEGDSPDQTPSEGSIQQQLSLTSLTAVSYSWLPAYDLLTVRYLLGVMEAGVFSKLQLFSKILYYAPLTLLQVSLPHYVRLLGGKKSDSSLSALRKLEWWGLLVSYLGISVFALLGPWVCRSVLHIQEFTSLQVGLVCLAVVPLYGLLSAIQIYAAAGRLLPGVVLIASTAAVILVAYLFHWRTLDQYLAFSAAANTILGLFGWYLSSRLLHSRQSVPAA